VASFTTEVKHGVHHTGHRSAGARAHRHEQRIGRIVEFLTGESLDVLDSFANVIVETLHYFIFSVLCVFCAYFGGNGEAGRYRHTEKVHLSQVGTFAAEQISHFGIAFGLTVTKQINSFHVV